jgi:hypothetical protein
MKSPDWSEFKLRIPVKAPIQDLYDAWSTQAGLEKWFLRQAIFKKRDNVLYDRHEHATRGAWYHWRWHGYTDDIEEIRQVTDANGKDFFQFLFTCNCLVSVSITPLSEKENMVELVQKNIPEDENAETNLFVHCQLGWSFYMTNLKSVMEYGIDLRNKDITLGKVITA